MSYGSTFARYYDLFYALKDYEGESKFLDAVIRAELAKNVEDVSILELACGTGNHSVLLAKRGYTIVGTDVSEAMLTEARRKAAGIPIVFTEMDMRYFHSFDAPFDVVLCLFDSIGYLLSNDAILGALTSVRKNLKPGGIFIMEFWNAGAMIQAHEPYREKIIKAGPLVIKRISETHLDYANQLAEVKYSMLESGNGNEFVSLGDEVHRNRFFLPQEMSFFLTQAGMKPLHFYPGFTTEGSPGVESWHTVAISTTL